MISPPPGLAATSVRKALGHLCTKPRQAPEMPAPVKGFGCRPVRDGSDAAVGRRSKASRGGNRGTRGRRRRCRDLLGLGGPFARVVRAYRGSCRRVGVVELKAAIMTCRSG